MARVKKAAYVPKEFRDSLTCKECKRDLPVSEFRKEGKTSAGTQKFCSRCNECFEAYAGTKYRSWIERNERVKLIDDILNSAKTECCACGYNKTPAALDFHHKDPSQKLFEVCDVKSQLKWVGKTQEGVTVEDLITEIEKCIVICSNCHREHHAGLLDVTNLQTVVVKVEAAT